jgi:uncharacterized protein (TIGR03437 family)
MEADPSGVVTMPVWNAIADAASLSPSQTVAPGELVSIAGTNLAAGTNQADSPPWGVSLGNTQVRMGAAQIPLMLTGPARIVGELPFDATANTEIGMTIRNGTTLSLPQPVVVAGAQPAIFMIADATTGLANGPNNPAHARDSVIIYSTGLGTVTPAIPAGAAPTGQETADAAVALTIGGIAAAAQPATLVAGMPGVYQMPAIVPDGVTPGDQVPVVISAAGQAGVPAALSIH